MRRDDVGVGDGPELRAALGTPLPRALEVGRGTVLMVQGRCEVAGARVAELHVRVGGNEASAALRDVPGPGEVAGAGWWTALVPIAPIAEPEAAAIALRAELPDGEELSTSLGSVRLEPGADPGSSGRETSSALVAICMATHDPPLDLLRAQIESIRSQTHRDWVCIVSDDCTPEDKWREVVRIVRDDERFRLSRAKERAGFYRNFERALRAAPEDAAFVALADQDDRWDADKLATLVAALREGDVLAHSDARVVGAGGEPIASTLWPDEPPRDDRLEDLLFANAVTGASCLFRRDVLDWALPFPPLAGQPYHDRWIALVSSVLGGVVRVDRPLYDYVQHGAAALGHMGVAGSGTADREGRLAGVRRRFQGLRARRFRPDWRAAHDGVLMRSVIEAMVLRLRLGERMTPAQRRAVARVEALPTSPAAQARVAARHLARAPARRPGLEGSLVRGIAWRRFVRPRALAARANKAMRRRAAATRQRAARPRRAGAAPRIGITVTEDSEAAGFGDYHTAHELGDELERLGYAVTYLEIRDRRRRSLRSIDVLISLLDRIPLDDVPPGVQTVAWVRNWTERWIERPWFERFDVVFASSERSRELIAERTSQAARLMPLATNAERFRRTEPDPSLAADLVFAGNHWSAERQVDRILPALVDEFDVKVFGRGWEAVPGMNGRHEGPLAYRRLPALYSSARLVVDDSGHHTRPYGAVNSRVFDALACGALVASNDVEGVRALFDDEFPVWTSADELRAHGRAALEKPERATELAARYRDEVLARHTYRHRAQQVRDALRS